MKVDTKETDMRKIVEKIYSAFLLITLIALLGMKLLNLKYSDSITLVLAFIVLMFSITLYLLPKEK
jgi:hypothetical protein